MYSSAWGCRKSFGSRVSPATAPAQDPIQSLHTKAGPRIATNWPFMPEPSVSPLPPQLPLNSPQSISSSPPQPLFPAGEGDHRSQAEKEPHPWTVAERNVDKFLICNTLGMGLWPLFECKFINKARPRIQGEADEKQKTRDFMPVSSVG